MLLFNGSSFTKPSRRVEEQLSREASLTSLSKAIESNATWQLPDMSILKSLRDKLLWLWGWRWNTHVTARASLVTRTASWLAVSPLLVEIENSRPSQVIS
jgi:hypothetical protein